MAPRPRIAIAGFQHETNTLCPMPTTFDDFEMDDIWPGLTRGDAIYDAFAGQNIPITGFFEPEPGFDLVPIVWSAAEPAGYVEDEAFERITAMMTDGLASAGSLDGVLLDLHGAMVTESHPDGEGETLRRVRATVGPDVPIVVSLDFHANLTQDIIDHADLLTIYRTYPHIDMAATGTRAARAISEILDRGERPRKAWRPGQFIVPICAQSTMREPAHRFYQTVVSQAGPDLVSADAALGFPPADIPDVGPAVVAYGWTQEAADTAADAMDAVLHRAESDFQVHLDQPETAVRRALDLAETASKPVVIADVQDNPGAGGIGDSTGVLRALIEAQAPDTCVSLLWDPATAERAHSEGVGAQFPAWIGGQYPDVSGDPVACTVTVEALSDGAIDFTGPMYGGSHGEMGPSALLRIHEGGGGIRVVVSSVRAQNADQEFFRFVGIEPGDHGIIVVKSTLHFLADYEPVAETVIFAEAPGSNVCDPRRIPYTRLRPGLRTAPN